MAKISLYPDIFNIVQTLCQDTLCSPRPLKSQHALLVRCYCDHKVSILQIDLSSNRHFEGVFQQVHPVPSILKCTASTKEFILFRFIVGLLGLRITGTCIEAFGYLSPGCIHVIEPVSRTFPLLPWYGIPSHVEGLLHSFVEASVDLVVLSGLLHNPVCSSVLMGPLL